MAYTVKELSKISKVSVRTLHYYDEIGLLKPAYFSDSGYRYYEKEHLLMLQQILFFKELGFELKKIGKILKQTEFDKMHALKSQKQVLKDNVSRLQLLIKTIDKTIKHIKGEINMKDEDMYLGFSKEKQKQYEDDLVNRYGNEAKKYIVESQNNIKSWTKQDFQQNKKEADDLAKELSSKLEAGLSPNSSEVQALMKRHYNMIKKFYTPSKKVYIGLGELYKDHKDFRKLYDGYHPKLAEFIADSMKVFAENEL